MKLPSIQLGLAFAAVSNGFGAIGTVKADNNETTTAGSNGNGSNSSNVDTLSWGACDDAPAPLECASFEVPLDWADESKGKIQLAVIRLPHNKTQPCEGYMLYNPGGPGASGRDLLIGGGHFFQEQLGQSWDLVSWDPRGVGKSEPNITIFADTLSAQSFWASQYQGRGHMGTHGNLTTQPDVDFFLSQATAFDDLLKSYNDKYVAKVGDVVKYIGTPAVVRDLVAITEAIYGQGVDINYYGFSYGTIVGAYLTQMFPQRIGKVILDGVVNAYLWSNAAPLKSLSGELGTIEKAVEGWATYCAAASDKCQTAQAALTLVHRGELSVNSTQTGNGNVTASDILALIEKVFDTAYQTYDGTIWLNGSAPASPTGWTYEEITELIYAGLDQSYLWKALDQQLVEIFTSQNNASLGENNSDDHANKTAALKRSQRNILQRRANSTFSLTNGPTITNDIGTAVCCGDAIDNNATTIELFHTAVNISHTITQHFGAHRTLQWLCTRWTSRAVERLPIPFTTKPKNVILVIGNTRDIVTTYAIARKLASEKHLGNSARLVKYHAVGHTSVSNPSTCISNLIHSFVRGDIPADAGNDGPDVECNIDINPFYMEGNPFN